MSEATALRELVILSLRDPAQAARVVLGMSLPREVLWTALMLMAVLNTLIYSLTNMAAPGPSPLPAAFSSPAFYFFFVAGALILIVNAVYWTGRAFGGQASMTDVMAVIVWLQFLRVLVQGLALVLLLTVPLLSALLVLAAILVGLWIFVHFVDQAHRFNSPGKAAGVIVAAFFAMVLGISILLALIGVSVPTGAVNGL